MVFYEFSDRVLNSLNKALSEKRAAFEGCSIINKRIVSVLPLKEILNKYIKRDLNIDFLSVDVEGNDLDVFK